MDRKELLDIWNNRTWRFFFWLISAGIAYRTSPDAGFPTALSAATGVLYFVMWLLLIRLDARVGRERVSPLMKFTLFLMAMMCITMAAGTGGTLNSVALFWMIPVGLPMQGLVRLVNDAASRSTPALAMVSLGLTAGLMVLRAVFYAGFRSREKN